MKYLFVISMLFFFIGTAFSLRYADEKPTNVNIPSEGVKLKAFPIILYNSDLWLGLGASFSLYKYDGNSKDYQWKLYSDFTVYTGGQLSVLFHFNIYSIRIANQPFHLYGFLRYKQARFQPYYGTNNTDTKNNFDINQFDDSNKYYYTYETINPYFYFTLTTPLLWGRAKNYNKEIGFVFGASVENNYNTNSTDIHGTMHNSKLFDENPYGYSGGALFSLTTGLTFDSRDYIPNPYHGTYNEALIGFTIGDYNFQRLSIIHTAYFGIFKTTKMHLIFAERVYFDNIFGDAPFFKMGKLGGSKIISGFGGSSSIRGIPAYRHIGNFKIMFNPELRWRFFNYRLFPKSDMWHLELVLFSDIGNAWDTIHSFTFAEVHATWGIGLRILWGEDFIAAFDFAFWGEEVGIYMGLNHQF